MIDKNFEASVSNVELWPFAMEKMGVEKKNKEIHIENFILFPVK